MAVLITTTFDGYPHEGVDAKGRRVSGPKRSFLKGETVTNLSPEYEDLIRSKGLAERLPPKNPPKAKAATSID